MRTGRSVTKYLSHCLDKYGFLSKSRDKFAPKFGKTSHQVVKLIINKFKPVLSEQLPDKNLDKLDVAPRPPSGRVGQYLSTVIQNMRQVEPHHQLLSLMDRHLQEGDQESLYELCNRNHRLLYMYWIQNNNPPEYTSDLYSYFCSPQVLDIIERDYLTTRHIKTKYAGNYLHLSLTGKNMRAVSGRLADSLLARCRCMLSLVHRVQDETFKIKIWLTDDQKRLQHRINPSQRYLGVRNVNSGCTIRDEIDRRIGRICIWRREECEKVLIHELIHAIRFDFYDYPSKYNGKIFNYYDLTDANNINLFEAYTEIWAVIFSSVIYALTDHDGTWEQIREILQRETRFAMFQLAKIIDYFGYSSFSECEFFCAQGVASNQPRKFNQGSSVLSYYIIKTALLYNLDDFLSYCLHYNSPVEPWQSGAVGDQLWRTIDTAINDSHFLRLADRALRSYRKYKECHHGDPDHNFSLVSLRMTCTG